MPSKTLGLPAELRGSEAGGDTLSRHDTVHGGMLTFAFPYYMSADSEKFLVTYMCSFDEIVILQSLHSGLSVYGVQFFEFLYCEFLDCWLNCVDDILVMFQIWSVWF